LQVRVACRSDNLQVIPVFMEKVVFRKELRPGRLAGNHFVNDIGSCNCVSLGYKEI
jgi:hypothetical protein